jgi:hypothetical protein
MPIFSTFIVALKKKLCNRIFEHSKKRFHYSNFSRRKYNILESKYSPGISLQRKSVLRDSNGYESLGIICNHYDNITSLRTLHSYNRYASILK